MKEEDDNRKIDSRQTTPPRAVGRPLGQGDYLQEGEFVNFFI